jgi:hypothetical protein
VSMASGFCPVVATSAGNLHFDSTLRVVRMVIYHQVLSSSHVVGQLLSEGEFLGSLPLVVTHLGRRLSTDRSSVALYGDDFIEIWSTCAKAVTKVPSEGSRLAQERC